MSMTTIQYNDHNIHESFNYFSKLVHLPKIIQKSNIKKSHGIKSEPLFEWLLTTIFNRYSIFRAEKSDDFSKNTVRNCINDAHTNWQRMVQLCAINLTQYVLRFTDPHRRQALIIDDSLFNREFSKKTELLARVFDHDKQCYLKGFRALTIGWSDGNTFLPVNFALMSSSKTSNLIGRIKHFDGRSLAAKRRHQAQLKMTDVALELVRNTIKSGIKAKYVLFDSWYTSPKFLSELLKYNLYSVCMFKKSKKVYFRYRNREMDVKTLYEVLCRSKYPTKSNYLYSPVVHFTIDGHDMPVKLVFVTNRGSNNKYLVLGTTNTDMGVKNIIQMYGRRWQIEGYFKVAKQYLQFDKTQIQNYDGLCGHMAMVILGYDILALHQRESVDDRTIGDLFYEFGRPMPDIKVADALSWLMKTIIGLAKKLNMTTEILDTIFDEFIKTLPSNLGRLLGNV